MSHEIPDDFTHRGTHAPVHFDEQSQRILTTDEREDTGEFITRFAARHGLTTKQALDELSEVQEALGGFASSSTNGMEALDKAREFRLRMAAGLAWLVGYDGDMKLAVKVFARRLGCMDVAGIGTGTDVEIGKSCSTKHHIVSKQTVNKCSKSLDKYLNGMGFTKLPTLPGQRDEAAREKMSAVTRENWQKRK